ncbi:MAG TPA: hypothetical protein VFJ93_07690 [Gaiellaceae bacterium]|nr:hypothetical protein [Gaiellaceae bacterium]
MPNYEYLFLELPHDRKVRVKQADLAVDEVPQIKAILDVYGRHGWRVVHFSESFTGAGAHFAPKFLLERELKPTA